ncbi:amino acid permease [Klugiella xanthotipulae]|uniref:Amino acid/polyamine/organocation transporter (APC superfamily) n=1 Tax=Klugiella xanthotipulae TaxID=244735 RepID=A0A543I6G2_9MICO|nr:amino acid permease [Klugiella xanthotipulae]TQM66196.1 amino acid/polyamine/organocation transporter (APC superfamily) [Klugiella xanthotipulae]
MNDFKKIQVREQGLKRQLTAAQMGMIALGGAIGTGLFLGSKFAIGFAGPSVILSYLIGGIVALLLMAALAEMTIKHPTTGSFGAYAEHYIGPLAGYLVRYMYWSCIVLAVGTEVTAIGEYMGFWFPGVPPWVWVIVFAGALILVNTMNVKAFGTLEYWFSSIKVFAILAFIVVGLIIVFGANRPQSGFQNLFEGGGFFPNGISGMWFAVVLSIFSYLSIEMIAVAAGEAENPQKAVRKAFKSTIFRLVIFYFLTLTLIVAIVPMGDLMAGGSPFVTAMQFVGIPFADGVLNFIVIIAALSAMNSQLYISTRMMFSLSRSGEAPKALGKLRPNGSPVNALIASTAGIAIATIVYVIWPATAFTFMMAISMFGAMFTWLMIFVTHWFFRRQVKRDGEKLEFRMPFHPLLTIVGIVMMVAILVTTVFIPDFQMTLVFGIPAVLLVTLMFYVTRTSRAAARQRDEAEWAAAAVADSAAESEGVSVHPDESDPAVASREER